MKPGPRTNDKIRNDTVYHKWEVCLQARICCFSAGKFQNYRKVGISGEVERPDETNGGEHTQEEEEARRLEFYDCHGSPQQVWWTTRNALSDGTGLPGWVLRKVLVVTYTISRCVKSLQGGVARYKTFSPWKRRYGTARANVEEHFFCVWRQKVTLLRFFKDGSHFCDICTFFKNTHASSLEDKTLFCTVECFA